MNAMTFDVNTLATVNLARLSHDPMIGRGCAEQEALCVLVPIAVASLGSGRSRQTGQRPTAGRVPNLAVLFAANHEGQAQGDKPKDSFVTLTIFA